MKMRVQWKKSAGRFIATVASMSPRSEKNRRNQSNFNFLPQKLIWRFTNRTAISCPSDHLMTIVFFSLSHSHGLTGKTFTTPIHLTSLSLGGMFRKKADGCTIKYGAVVAV